MSDKKNVFGRMFDSIAEGRSRQAQRFVDSYLESHGLPRQLKSNVDEAFTRR